jgi:competence protein ComEA
LNAENELVQARKRYIALTVTAFVISIAFIGSSAFALPKATAVQSVTKPKAIPSPEARVDINHASVDELLRVPGMTKSWAGRIVRFRPYRSKQDLVEHGVLPSDVYDRIKDYVIAHRGEP